MCKVGEAPKANLMSWPREECLSHDEDSIAEGTIKEQYEEENILRTLGFRATTFFSTLLRTYSLLSSLQRTMSTFASESIND